MYGRSENFDIQVRNILPYPPVSSSPPPSRAGDDASSDLLELPAWLLVIVLLVTLLPHHVTIMTHAHSSFGKMDAAALGALAAAQKDAAGPTMMFAKVGASAEASKGATGSGEDDDVELLKEETDNVGGRLQHVRAAAQQL